MKQIKLKTLLKEWDNDEGKPFQKSGSPSSTKKNTIFDIFAVARKLDFRQEFSPNETSSEDIYKKNLYKKYSNNRYNIELFAELHRQIYVTINKKGSSSVRKLGFYLDDKYDENSTYLGLLGLFETLSDK